MKPTGICFACALDDMFSGFNLLDQVILRFSQTLKDPAFAQNNLTLDNAFRTINLLYFNYYQISQLDDKSAILNNIVICLVSTFLRKLQ